MIEVKQDEQAGRGLGFLRAVLAAASLIPELIRITPEVLREIRNLLRQRLQGEAAEVPTKAQLQAEGRIHGPEAYAKLELKVEGEIPAIPEDLIALCAAQPVRSMIILKGVIPPSALEDLSKKHGWIMSIDENVQQKFSTEKGQLEWAIVPMEPCRDPETQGLPKARAVETVQKSAKGITIVPPGLESLALGIFLHHVATGENLFEGVYTFTDKSNTVVGFSRAVGFSVYVSNYYVDDNGNDHVALAPVGIKKT